MYLCAKLVGLATAILSAGTVSPLVIPYLKNTNSWLFKQDSSTHKYDFQELDNTVEERLKKLTHWLERFTSAKTTAKELKESELAKIQPLFNKIFETEESIKKLFEKIAETLTNLVKKHEEFFNNSTKKLEAEKKEKLHKILKEKYSEFKKTLKGWETSLNQISCAIEKKERECDRTKVAGEISLLFKPIDSLFSYFLSKTETNKQSQEGGTDGENQEGAKKAQQDLETVKKALLGSVEDFQKQSVRYGTQLAFAVSNEKIATMLLIVFSAIVKSLDEQIKTLTEDIKKNNQSSDEQMQQINKFQDQLKTSYKDYSDLKQLESLFQWWQEMFDEKITQNEDEKAREEDVARRKRRK